MKLQSTFKFINGPAYSIHNQEPIDSDVVFLQDHFPDYPVDYNKSKEELLKTHIGHSVFHDNCINPKDKIWIYDSYLYLNDNFDNIYLPIMDLNIHNYFNNDSPKIKRRYKFVTFNNKSRFHRIIASSWINENFKPNEYFYTSGFNAEQDGITEHLLFIDKLYPGLPEKIIGPDPSINDGGDIFTKYFYPHSSDAVFNIVNDVSFWELGCHLSEKTFWSFLSYNIPIVSGYGMAKSLEAIGFDMFTDIVNYSSQFTENPFVRTFQLLNNNKQVLENAFDILDSSILERLGHNKNLLLNPDIQKIAIKNINSPKMLAKFEELCYNDNINALKKEKKYLQ